MVTSLKDEIKTLETKIEKNDADILKLQEEINDKKCKLEEAQTMMQLATVKMEENKKRIIL